MDFTNPAFRMIPSIFKYCFKPIILMLYRFSIYICLKFWDFLQLYIDSFNSFSLFLSYFLVTVLSYFLPMSVTFSNILRMLNRTFYLIHRGTFSFLYLSYLVPFIEKFRTQFFLKTSINLSKTGVYFYSTWLRQ